MDWIVPKSFKSLRGFLNLLGYYRKFIKHYGSIVVPLTMLLKKSISLWSKEASTAFLKLKQVVTLPPVLKQPNIKKEFKIECDSCGVELGAVIMQKGQPIGFISIAFKCKALMLSSYEKELLALVSIVARWRPYLLGQSFKIKSKQQALKYLLEQKVETKHNRSGFQSYWTISSK